VVKYRRASHEPDFDGGELSSFSPGLTRFWGYLKGKQTERWGASNVHCCNVDTFGGFEWFDWTQPGNRAEQSLVFKAKLNSDFCLIWRRGRCQFTRMVEVEGWGVLLVRGNHRCCFNRLKCQSSVDESCLTMTINFAFSPDGRNISNIVDA